jgi:hypothetical protein
LNLTLRYRIPANREKLGSCELVSSECELVLGPFICLARSDNQKAARAMNPTRDPLKPFGDTPAGLYRVSIEPPGEIFAYGPGRRLLFQGIGGPAKEAMHVRSGIMAHGGKLNPKYTWWQGLRPTYGCIRHLDADLEQILARIDSAGGEVSADVTTGYK